MLISCTENSIHSGNITEDGEEIKIKTDIATEIRARGYEEDISSGRVESGEFYLTYPQASNNENIVATVTFGNDNGATNPEFGRVNIPTGKPFKWLEIGGGATPTFFLDNVKGSETSYINSTNIEFNKDYNPYKAALFDSITGSNDLLWSTDQFGRDKTNTLHFNLHHNMSRIKIQVTVDKTYDYENGDLELAGAKVELTNINLAPLSYNRLDGTLTLESSENTEALGALTFVSGDDTEGPHWIWNNEFEESSKNEENKIFTYITPSFVVPPQGLMSNENRPRLIITMKNGISYSGILPQVMEIESPNPTDEDLGLSYPVALYFLKEHILTIRTVITQEPPALVFMPVKVIEWVDKGEFTVEGHQSGIYLPAEFNKLIEYYNNNNKYQLVRYGDYITDDGLWDFKIWSSLILNYNDIAGEMIPGVETEKGETPPFRFSFNGYSVYIIMNDNTLNKVSEEELHDIVTRVP
ncbi:MAG: fimbrillin family protein [Muribaculaceae bacterium]|nr:fimbrillin family protein [Muribaculaceae bacterium]